MSKLTTTTRAVGPVRISVRAHSAEMAARLEWLLGDFPDAGDAEPSMIAEVTRQDDGRYVLHIDGKRSGRSRTAFEIEARLTRGLNRRLLDEQAEMLHLHAGAVTRGGMVVLVVGTSGAGKSTLVAKLVSHGWAYLSDEQIGVDCDGNLFPYARPITLRRGSWRFFPSVDGVPDPSQIDDDRVEVPASAFGPIHGGGSGRATLVVIPDAAAEGSRVEPISAGALFAALVADTLDLERAGEDGVAALLATVCGAAGVRISGGDLDRTIAQVDELASADNTGPAIVDHAPAAAGHAHATGARAWSFDDGSAVAYDCDGGACAVLDHAGFEAWRALGKPRSAWPHELAGSDFVAELVSVGLLTEAAAE